MESIEVYRVMYSMRRNGSGEGEVGGKKVSLHQLTKGQLRSGELVVQ